MKAQELRIGNWVTYNLREHQIDKHDFFEDLFENGHYMPIPITEEWLKRLGFEKDEFSEWTHSLDDVGIFINRGGVYERDGRMILEYYEEGQNTHFDEGYYFECYLCYIHIKHVHQLQNLFFSLTGTELIEQ